MRQLLTIIIMTQAVIIAGLYLQPKPALFEQVVIDQPECPGMTGPGINLAGVGMTTRATSDAECNERANALLMLAAGMPDNAKLSACQTASSMRNYANVDNCMHADTRNYGMILADVNRKRQLCGGKPKWFRTLKRRKYWACMGAVQ